ncbi:SAM-dependent methyltransferase [Tepiditoga spiralis]|uniref:SAM-dependent methyltransferase n=1 Tax=Tepiditoga spiralis TaxID=2108365 RepID=A0A7G1G209_9BACT|nr:methyltransferase [Tepiditoga spiralis]BBE29875.1 SAM-dependent methyltransferase [Tepiditoga spiralis]
MKKNREEEREEVVDLFSSDELYNLKVDEVIKILNEREKNSKPIEEEKEKIFEHYYTENPTSELTIKELTFVLHNSHIYKLKAPSGVYGKKRIDRASALLIENVEITGKKLLDIGCGYGVIGIVLKKENPNIEVFMSDINNRAVQFTKINAKDNNANVEVRSGYLFEPWKDEKFDMIISNPPIVAGKHVWMKLIEDGFKHLNTEGTMQLVAFHNKGGKRIKEYMKNIFGNVTDVVKSGGARVYKSVKED